MAVRGSMLVALCSLLLAVPVHSARVAPSGRSLLLATGSCPTKIAGCETNRCGTKLVDGTSSSVCERCKVNYIRANNGLQCVCPPGLYESGTGALAACVPCEQAFFCPGGDRLARNSALPVKIGVRYPCHKPGSSVLNSTAAIEALGITTKSPRARRYTDCVPKAGYYLKVASSAAQEAQQCGPHTYSPGFSRLRACFKCQSGLTEPFGVYTAALNAPLRTDKSQVCGVPKGRYLSQNVVRDCPAGTFRSTWELVTDVNARYCFACPIGITTRGAASESFGDCKVALAGFQINFKDNVLAMDVSRTSDPQDPSLTPPQCPIGTYYPGGVITESTNSTCITCPLGSTTQSIGSSAVEDCMVPPGYFIKTTTVGSDTTGVLTKCPNDVALPSMMRTGFYRQGWKSALDPTVQSTTDGRDACTPCGENILSDYTDIDELGTGNDTSALVAASPASCYIEAGWGMTLVALEFNKWRANQCANNSYGVETRTYGLQQSPCKPCQRFMITLRAGANNYTECINPAGFGFTTDGVSQCPMGFYTWQGSMAPCTACASGRTTEFDPDRPDLQDNSTDCIVAPGNGVFSGNFTPTLAGNNATDVLLSVLPCPAGYFSNGGAVATKCTPCTNGYTTIDEGTIGNNNSVCTVCSAGYGLPTAFNPMDIASACGECTYGSYQTGYTGTAFLNVVGDGRSCHSCAQTNFTYVGSKGKKARYFSEGITFYTKSMGPEACVPRYAQLMIDAGQIYGLPDSAWNASAAGTAQLCIDACMAISNTGKACFAQFDYTDTANNTENGTCKTITLDPASSQITNNVLLMRMMPSDPIAAASVDEDDASAKAMASGLYSRVAIATPLTPTDFGQELATDTSEALCRQKCDQNSRCWGVVVAANGGCSLRTGLDSLDARSFFFNPSPPAVGGLNALKW